ncbi:hypothetical protein EON81_02760 [bacterium]|nr:MAG: hypothetical protein EON81_02760 [bacterium]
MSSTNLRIAERNARLARLVAVLETDSRVEAAWLFGSLAIGPGDAWSDLDIWISVRDDAFASFVEGRAALAAKVDGPLFAVEAPQNAPVGGAYYQTVHDDPTGPHVVDWYMQPSSIAGLPSEPALLIRPRGGSRSPSFGYRMEEIAEEDHPRNAAGVFWMMVLVQAKYVARKPHEAGLGFLGFLDDLMDRARENRGLALPQKATFESSDSSARLGELRKRVDQMTEIEPLSPAVPGRTSAFLDTVEASIL